MNCTREQLIKEIRSQMPTARWQHTVGVMQTAVQLAHQYGADPCKADLAALLHDVAKYWEPEKMKRILIEHCLPSSLLQYNPQLWHAPVGAVVAKYEYGIVDEEILDAIRYHTSGREQMTPLDKIICLADYIEPNRKFPEVDEMRQLAKCNLDGALLMGFDATIRLLLMRRNRIFPLLIIARNHLLGAGSDLIKGN